MKLQTLRPRLAAAPARLQTLTTETTAPRPAGRPWQATRLRIQIRDGSMCAKCGLLWNPTRDAVDHLHPRWAGGSDDDSNLALLHSTPCHADKSAQEEAMRRAGGYVMPDWVAALLRERAKG
ncbi:HNH endonuclease signature motif containing protein [Ramlibacter sp.]|uniref:HNH endonuclease n=1 Tax=Ramlibacter sp. TaxID=1917967 RepID=UPI002D5ABECA|nr:HNH endonuclease signature motif containing protein [Ramlibacter sp.]HYD75750.1 HNH endonuclease signature motif containing protein [Ramlibacter sp.]